MKIVLTFFFSIILLFYGLDKPLLWQDEGEVAMIARNITKYGLPVTYDGNTLITQTEGNDSIYLGNKRVWSWNTWLPYYAVAVSFKLFGESTTTARLPFAVAGVAVLIVTYLLAKKMQINPVICLLVLATNTIFYLYIRQARYYAFSILFPLCAVYFYFSRRYFLYFLSLLAGFHSNFVLAFGFNLPLILFSLKRKTTWLFLAQSLVWLWFFHPPPGYWAGFQSVITKIGSYVNIINSFYFPLILGVFILNPVLTVLLLGTITHVVVISLFLPFGQRYLVTLIPIFSLFIAFFLNKVWLKNKFLCLLILPFFLFTNIPFILSERTLHPTYFFKKPEVRSFFLDYLTSLPKSYPGPLEGIVGFLSGEKISNNSTLIYTDYEINSLRFYFPNLRFVDHPSQDVIYWLPRHSWGFLNELTPCEKQLLENQSKKITLSNFDTQWENMPDITYHQFTISRDTPRVIIYKVVDGINWKQCD